MCSGIVDQDVDVAACSLCHCIPKGLQASQIPMIKSKRDNVVELLRQVCERLYSTHCCENRDAAPCEFEREAFAYAAATARDDREISCGPLT